MMKLTPGCLYKTASWSCSTFKPADIDRLLMRNRGFDIPANSHVLFLEKWALDSYWIWVLYKDQICLISMNNIGS